MRWRFRRQNTSRFWSAGAMSLLVHGMGAYGISVMPVPDPPPVEEKVLQIRVVAMGKQADVVEPPTPEPAAPEPPAQPSKTKPVSEVTPASTSEPSLTTAVVNEPLPFSNTPSRHPTPPASMPQSFSDWRKQRMAKLMPTHFPNKGEGGADIGSSQGVDRCEPFPGRHLDRLYLLYDSSGSMTGSLEGQALRCAHQYAQAAISNGAEVVVGNFAGGTVLSEPTRNMTVVATTLRASNNHNYTMLPSTELYRVFEQRPDASADLVILSDGYIPNYREVMSTYQYFLELNSHNRGYLYTLGVSGHPEVTAALRDIGFDIYIYRLF